METTLSITTEKLNSANIAVKSGGWTDYELRADVAVGGGKVTNTDGGRVIRLSDNAYVATFNTMAGPGMDGNNITITYMVAEIAVQCEINQRVNEFIAALRAKTFTPSNLSF